MALKTLITAFLTMGFAISCSDVKFSNAPSAECAAADNCISDPSDETLTKVLSVPFPNNKVDILFIVDNSRTMLQEQSKLQNRLQDFLNRINNLDYRIAIATTDNGAPQRTDLFDPQDYRHGAIVPFVEYHNGQGGFRYAKDSNGSKIYYITKNTPQASNLFRNTVYRPESAWCANNQSICPSVVSGDERGIYSAIRNIQGNARSFMRTDAQLHVVIISDEDERSNGGGFSGMPIVSGQDRAEDLLNVLRSLNKRTRVHSLVGLPSGQFNFASCVASQISNTSKQEYLGCHYIKAAVDSGGVVASKDLSDYSGPLAAIGNDIDDTSIRNFTFNCKPSEVTFKKVSGSFPFPNDPHKIFNLQSNSYNFSTALQPGSVMEITWKCPRN